MSESVDTRPPRISTLSTARVQVSSSANDTQQVHPNITSHEPAPKPQFQLRFSECVRVMATLRVIITVHFFMRCDNRGNFRAHRPRAVATRLGQSVQVPVGTCMQSKSMSVSVRVRGAPHSDAEGASAS